MILAGSLKLTDEIRQQQRELDVAYRYGKSYEESLVEGIERGRADYQAGRVIEGVDAARDELKR